MSRASEYAANVSRILQQKGQAVAEGHRRSGAIVGGTIATLGQVVPQQVQDVMKRNAEKRRTEQLQGIFQKHKDDLPSAISEVMAIDPDLGLDLSKRYQDAATAAFNYKTAQWKAKKDELETVGTLIGSATDEASYAQALVTAKMMGLDLANVPPAYSPAVVEQYNRALLTAKERLELDKPKEPKTWALTPGMKVARETPEGGVEVIAENPYELTPDQQADNERMAKAEERAAAAQAEQVRHNQATEAISRMTAGRAEAAQAETARHNRAMEGMRQQEINKPDSATGGAKLSATAIEKIAGIDQSLGVIESLEQYKKDEWLGPVAGRAAQVRIKTPGVKVSDDLARFAAETATLKNAVIKAITGAQMSQGEAERIMSQIPSFEDKPNVWTEKAAATKANLATLKRRTIELSGGTAAPAAPPARSGGPGKPSGKIGPYSFQVE